MSNDLLEIKGIFNFIPGGDTLSISILYFIASAFLSFIMAPFWIKLLYKFNITRKPKDDNKTKFDEINGKIGTPIMGGIIFLTTTLIITLIFNWKRDYTWIPIGAIILTACIGGIDDLLSAFNQKRKIPLDTKTHIRVAFVHKSIKKRILYFLTIPLVIIQRLLIHIGSNPKFGLMVYEKLFLQTIIGLVVGLWVYMKLGWSHLWIPAILLNQSWFLNFLSFFNIKILKDLSSIDVGWSIIIIIIFIIILISNAVNISDGMDGLAGGLSFIAFTSLAIIAFGISEYGRIIENDIIYGMRSIVYLSATAAGSILSYLYFNIKPARIQMGDLGSLSIGTLISVIAIILNRELVLIFICGVFLINGIFPRIIQKIAIKFFNKKIFLMIPLHYHFALKGWPEEKIVTRFWIFSIILSAIGIWLAGV